MQGEQGRLAWRCRRGMKELDLVLMRYLRERWPTASGAERDLFERVLDLPDPELAACLMGRATAPDRELQAMLELLRGREHVVHSGLCLWRRPDDVVLADVETTRLVMDPISDADLAAYLATAAWEGKAGAFGYQDGIEWVHVARGSESNVVGLPLELLQRLLGQLEP